jgi:diguanylate cyclase (GGDEF)-like protein
MYGLSLDKMKEGTSLRTILEYRVASGNSPQETEQYIEERLAEVSRSLAFRAVNKPRDGRYIAVAHQPMPHGGWVSLHQDITEQKRAEQRIAHLAHHDGLTDLPNRGLLRERLDAALSRLRNGHCLAVHYLDLDLFKHVNDTLGHAIGDELLKAVAQRLQTFVREADIIARLGGDEFAIVQTGLRRASDASMLAQRLRGAFQTPYELNEHQIVIDVSIGIAVAPSDGDDADKLLRRADLALYAAKSDGRATYRFFEPQMDGRLKARRALEVAMRAALSNGEFELHYQPVMNLTRGQVSGCEALLRWRHPERGMILPGEFIPVAEETGLISQIGEWVLRTACKQAASWPGHVKVAINVSPIQFKSNTLALAVVSALAESGLPAARLEIEITEAVLMQHNDATLATLHQLRDLGIEIVMDDFGTGYSSLRYLRSFPFDKIKIDRSFISDLSEDEESIAIVRAITALAGSLNIATTAEGVETPAQLEKVRALGCTEVQGYLFSAPLEAQDLARWLASRRIGLERVA